MWDNIEGTLSLLGVVVSVASAVASGLNEHIRNAEKVGKTLAAAQAIVNVLALNLDKTKQAITLLRKK